MNKLEKNQQFREKVTKILQATTITVSENCDNLGKLMNIESEEVKRLKDLLSKINYIQTYLLLYASDESIMLSKSGKLIKVESNGIKNMKNEEIADFLLEMKHENDQHVYHGLGKDSSQTGQNK